MTERAQALEAALEKARRGVIGFAAEIQDGRVPVVGAVRDHLVLNLGLIASFLSDALLAVPPPPPAGSPTTEKIRKFTVYICDDCLHLRGEMCNEPGCRFCRRTMAEVAEHLDALLIRPRIDGVSVLVDEGAPLPAPVSPVEPEPPTVECCACGHLNTPQQATRLEGEWRSSGEYVCLDSDACSRRIAKCSERPVEPEPCVWRADWREGRDGSILVPSCQPEMEIDAAFVQECVKLHGWKFCTHCGAPLKVEKP